MMTQTMEREELQQVINMLPDDSIVAILNFARGLKPYIEATKWVDNIETGTWNAETMNAIQELDGGGGAQFDTAEELFKDLDI